MKRVQSACLNQTVHFRLKDDIEHDEAVREVQAEYAEYKRRLEEKKAKYEITEETIQPDGSIIIKIRKQYNKYDTAGYLD